MCAPDGQPGFVGHAERRANPMGFAGDNCGAQLRRHRRSQGVGADAGHLADALMPALSGGWEKFSHRPTSGRLGPGRSRVRRAPIDLPVAPLHVALRCGERGEAVPRV